MRRSAVAVFSILLPCLAFAGHIDLNLSLDATIPGLSHEIEQAVADVWPASRTTVHIEPINTDDARYQKWIEGQPKVHVDEQRPDDREFIS